MTDSTKGKQGKQGAIGKARKTGIERANAYLQGKPSQEELGTALNHARASAANEHISLDERIAAEMFIKTVSHETDNHDIVLAKPVLRNNQRQAASSHPDKSSIPESSTNKTKKEKIRRGITINFDLLGWRKRFLNQKNLDRGKELTRHPIFWPVVTVLAVIVVVNWLGGSVEVSLILAGVAARLVASNKGASAGASQVWGIIPTLPLLAGSWWGCGLAVIFHLVVWRTPRKSKKEHDDEKEDSDDDNKVED